MKRSRELEIMMNSLMDAGVPCTPQIHDAVARGLRHIRAEKFAERDKQKSQQGRNPC